VWAQSEEGLEVLMDADYDMLGRRECYVGDSVIAWSHADDGYIGGGQPHTIWGSSWRPSWICCLATL